MTLNKFIFLIPCLLWFLPPAPLYAVENFGAADFLTRGIGSRATGMGGAFIALADDVTATYWNPAGLGQMDLDLYWIGSEYGHLGPDINSSYLAYALHLPDVGSFALSWMNQTIMGMRARNDAGELLYDFGSYEDVFFLSYGRKCYDWVTGLHLGTNIKLLRHSLDDGSALGFGLDLGVIYQPFLFQDHTLGFVLQNIGQHLEWEGGASARDTSPLTAKLGTALRFFPSDDIPYFHYVITTLDIGFSEYSRFFYSLGMEYWHIKTLGIRVGYNPLEATCGLSYRPDYFELAYAFHYDQSGLQLHQHTFSLLLRFK